MQAEATGFWRQNRCEVNIDFKEDIMAKQSWKPGNMLYPLPVVLVTVRDKEGNDNVLTLAWAGTVCSDPAMLSISVRPERHSYKALMETKEFVVNLTTKDLVRATDYCGVKSGKDVDKFKECNLTKEEANEVNCSMIKESPVNIECKVVEYREYGSHTMFVAEVVAVHADEKYMNENGKFEFEKADPIAYSHGVYYNLGERLVSFGFSVKK